MLSSPNSNSAILQKPSQFKIVMLARLQDLDLVADFHDGAPLHRHEHHAQTRHLRHALVDAPEAPQCLVWLGAVRDARDLVHIGQLAAAGAAGDVVLVLADPDALPDVLSVGSGPGDDDVATELQDAELGGVLGQLGGDVVDAGEVEDVQGIGVGETDDGLPAQLVFLGGVAENLAGFVGRDAEEGEGVGDVEEVAEFLEIGGGVGGVGGADTQRLGFISPNFHVVGRVAVGLDLLRGGIERDSDRVIRFSAKAGGQLVQTSPEAVSNPRVSHDHDSTALDVRFPRRVCGR